LKEKKEESCKGGEKERTSDAWTDTISSKKGKERVRGPKEVSRHRFK